MIHGLRAKLAFSHVLPILLLMPALSLFLFYSLENFFTQSLLQQLTYQASLLKNRVERDPSVLSNANGAGDFLHEISGLTDARVLLLTTDGTILGSTRFEDTDRVGTRYLAPAVSKALNGEAAQGVGPGFAAEVAYIVLPLRQNGTIMGALRVSYEVTDVRAQFNQLQLLIFGDAALTLALALGLSFALATTITRPLRQLSAGAERIAAGDFQARVSAGGRDEVGILARSFNQMATRLGELEHARQRQLAAITHELARPLTGMRAAVETLREGADADAEMTSALMDGVADELGRLQRLIEALQGVQKRTVRPLDLHYSLVSPERLIRASIANFEALATQSGVALSADLPPHLSLLRADEDRLIQVLTNLLDNAIKFTPPGGKVTVRAEEADNCVRISVEDTGMGIATEELPNIFQEFYHSETAQPVEKHGMGLGLTISRQIVQAHGGIVSAESSLGQGATFTFTLPKS